MMADQEMHLDQAHDYLDKVIEALRVIPRPDKGPLVPVLENLSRFMRQARSEISALRKPGSQSDLFSVATDELEEIVAETAKATNAIMAATESIAVEARDLPEAQADRLIDATTRIYEA